MTSRIWLAQRAALALGLMVSFYVLAIGLAALLLSLIYLQAVFFKQVNWAISLTLLLAAASILWSIVPRADKFVAPGPRVAAADAPALFAAIEEVAASMGQAMPADVYLLNDVNAFVAQRGGVMGVGGHRVMGLGLPLMQAVSVQELKGIVAHEFGHYHSGDVALGPLIYKTRGAIGRTIQHVSNNQIRKIFIWYGNLFLRLTHAVSRRQEFSADEVAASTAGAGVMIAGLRKVHGAAVAFPHYWGREVAPILGSGFLPPLSQGFSRFIQHEAIATQMALAVAHEEARRETNVYDTHPALRERVSALALLPPGAGGDDRPASTLLPNVHDWERRILATVVNDDWARALQPIDWERTVDSVYMPMWRERVKRGHGLIAQLTMATIPTSRHELARMGYIFARAIGEEAPNAPEEVNIIRAMQLLTAAMAVALTALGWTVVASVGDEIVFRRGGDELRPYTELRGVLGRAEGEFVQFQRRAELESEARAIGAAWRARCEALGVADVRLVSEAAV